MNSAIRFLAALVALSLSSGGDVFAERMTQPNIVLVVADYMGYADIGPYGATNIRTPALDSLARDGVKFSSYYSASPVCGPSRAAMLSGFYPARIGIETNISPEKSGMPAVKNTLVRGLKSANYRTAMVGKWHLGRGEGFSPLSHGFDQFFGFHSWTLGYHDHLTSSGNPGLYRGDDLVSEEGYLTDLLTNEVNEFIQQPSEQPFFVYLAYNVGLPPYQAPDLPQSEWSSGWDANEASRDDYVAMIESMDQGIGRILQQLEALKLADDTLVIFTYDHGGRHLAQSEPLFHGFATLWEGGIRVPLLMRWPEKIDVNPDVERPTIAMDLTATMLAAAGRELAPLQLDGTSLLPQLAGDDDVATDALFWRFYTQGDPMKAVRYGDFKYVVDRGSQFLFDLSKDIGERKNLFAEQKETANELRELLQDWEQSFVESDSESAAE